METLAVYKVADEGVWCRNSNRCVYFVLLVRAATLHVVRRRRQPEQCPRVPSCADSPRNSYLASTAAEQKFEIRHLPSPIVLSTTSVLESKLRVRILHLLDHPNIFSMTSRVVWCI
ncbi:hypothetical protein L1987_69285 [Smallanthus sonchifolius]|uniref:Uncharacterized protein n=1 Tax=Smallanthus sonchifolius TaxID=185202 RepID=A0ACB9B6M6_9ASTR|nr:hypothetical protein L1987_69285 [Smallanthus sonchifolius]